MIIILIKLQHYLQSSKILAANNIINVHVQWYCLLIKRNIWWGGTWRAVKLLQQPFLQWSTVSWTENKEQDKESGLDTAVYMYLVGSCSPFPFWWAEFAPWWLFAKEPSVPWMTFCVPPFLPMMHSGECPFLDLTNKYKNCALRTTQNLSTHFKNILVQVHISSETNTLYRLPWQIHLRQPIPP